MSFTSLLLDRKQARDLEDCCRDLQTDTNNYLSPWNPERLLLPLVHHGEKFSTNQPNIQIMANPTLHDTGAINFTCVDPYVINPIVERPLSPSESTNTNIQLNFSVSTQDMDMNPCGGFYGSTGKIKMEDIVDLDQYLPTTLPKPTSSNSVDELNTPVFEKEYFDYVTYVPALKPSLSDEEDNCDIFNASLRQYNTTNLTDSIFPSENDYSISNNSITQNSNLSYMLSPSATENGNVSYQSSECESPPYEQFTPTNPYNSSSIICTPEESNCSSTSNKSTRQTNVQLNLDFRPPVPENINTPEVIDTIVGFETRNFNILDLVGAEELTTVNPEDIFNLSNDKTQKNTYTTHIPKKVPRRRKRVSESDEEYVPPIKIERNGKHLMVVASSEDCDSDYDERRPAKSRKTQRKYSVASSTSKDSDSSKYRDLRDKNNEASRKSRMKRKVKEQHLEIECEELEEKNLKLKAQVEELEKTVTSYRDNLFKIMIKK